MTANEAQAATLRLNEYCIAHDLAFASRSEGSLPPFVYRERGDEEVVTFLGVRIWDSDNDDRRLQSSGVPGEGMMPTLVDHFCWHAVKLLRTHEQTLSEFLDS